MEESSSLDPPVEASHSDAATPAPEDAHRGSASKYEIIPPDAPPPEGEELGERVKTILIGKPRDLRDRSIVQHLSLVAFLAWVGLGADGLSSSCYGPAEAFHTLGQHTHLAIFLALATTLTVLIISACYSHIVEEFPGDGGGYVVATKLLGPSLGVVSGSALLVDYVLTITVSIAAAGDALFGLMAPEWRGWKMPVEIGMTLTLIVLNLRGVKESVQILMPIFLLFLATHAVLLVGGISVHASDIGGVAAEVREAIAHDVGPSGIGLWGVLLLVLHAYSLGAGTYTGIEAVSNNMHVMREPRVATAKRTMLYMAISLALTAGGLTVCYLLFHVADYVGTGKTLNQVLTERFMVDVGLGDSWGGWAFVLATMISEGMLLIVAAQAGFIGGPRVLANLAQDSWLPHWFGNLSERLTTHNGVILMGAAALAALLYTGGNVGQLVIMYAINVFVTFSLSMIAMCKHWWSLRRRSPLWRRRLTLFGVGATTCVTILVITVIEKLQSGGWITILVTSGTVGLCVLTRRYYRSVTARLSHLNETLTQLAAQGPMNLAEPDPSQPTAAILVGGYSGLGVHTLLNAYRFAPGYYKNFVFLSVGVLDSGNFKGPNAVDALREHTEDSLQQYVQLARKLGLPAKGYMAVGTDPVDDLEALCRQIAKDFPKITFFAGQLIFRRDTWYQRIMHNQTAFSLQRRLQWSGLPMVILPTRVK